MAKPNLQQFMVNTRTAIVKHSPEILMGFGIAGWAVGTVLAVKATPKAVRCIEEATYEKEDDLSPLEIVKATWKCYIPAAVTCVAATGCLIGSCSTSVRRHAALATAYKLSETALDEYREQVIETVGEKKEKDIQEKVNQKQINKTPVEQSNIVNTGKGTTLMLDPLSQRYFRSDLEFVRRAENNLNKEILHSIYGTVNINDFYDEIGIPRTETGDMMGWNTDRMIDLNITSGITDWGEPCIVIAHYNRPDYLM
jgi:hypothetical protein